MILKQDKKDNPKLIVAYSIMAKIAVEIAQGKRKVNSSKGGSA